MVLHQADAIISIRHPPERALVTLQATWSLDQARVFRIFWPLSHHYSRVMRSQTTLLHRKGGSSPHFHKNKKQTEKSQ